MTNLPQVTGGEGELLLLLEHCQPSEMSQRPKSHQVSISIKSEVQPANALQAQEVGGGVEKGGRQVLMEQLLFLETLFIVHCLKSLVGLIGRVLKKYRIIGEFFPTWDDAGEGSP